MLQKILGALVVVIIILVGGAYALPREVHIERSILIDRPAATIFPLVNSFQRFGEWSPWMDADPNVRITLSGAESGVGARLAWAGNDKVGSGSERITASVADRSVSYELDFGRQGPAKAAFSLEPVGPATQVTWSLDVDVGNNPVGRYMGLALPGIIGKDYDKGLARLKALAERAAAAEPAAEPAVSR
jgi:hypothetical protein